MAIANGVTHGTQNSTATSSLATGAFFITNGREIFVGVAIADVTKSVSTITDTLSGVYTFVTSVTNGSSVRLELWRRTGGTANNNVVITVNLSAASLMSFMVQEYSGTNSALPQNNATNIGSDFYPMVRVLTQTYADAAIGFHAYIHTPGDTFNSANTGTIRNTAYPSVASVAIAVIDNTTGAISYTGTMTRLSAIRDWAVISICARNSGASVATYIDYQDQVILPNFNRQRARFMNHPTFCKDSMTVGSGAGGNTGFVA